MTSKSNELIHVKCNYCGKMFTTPRANLDNTPGYIMSIGSHFEINIALPHPTFTGVSCQYLTTAALGDYCPVCCIIFLKTGLKNLENQIKTGKCNFYP